MLMAGARPNFIKIAPLLEAFNAYPEVSTYLVTQVNTTTKE